MDILSYSKASANTQAITESSTLNEKYFSSISGSRGDLIFLNNAFYKILSLYLEGMTYLYTYYVDQVDGNDSNDGLSPATAFKTVTKANTINYLPSTQVLFKRGCVWREELDVTDAGRMNKPIKFGAYGEGKRPVFDGSDVITGFSLVSGSYDATVAVAPTVVIVNGTRGVLKASKAACTTNGDWYWAANVLSVKWGSDPSGLVESSARTYCILGYNGYNNIVFDGLKMRGAKNSGIFARGHNTIIYDCEVTDLGDSNGYSGILIAGNNSIIANNYVHDIGGTGIMNEAAAPSDCVVINNTVVNCWNKLQYTSGSGAGRGIWTSGVKRWMLLYNWVEGCYMGTHDTGCEDTLIAYNVVKASVVNGINMSTGVAGHPRKVYNNTVYHTPQVNAGHGIVIQEVVDNVGHAIIKNNLVYMHYTYGTLGSVHCIWVGGAYAGIDIDYNLLYKTAGSTNGYLAAVGNTNVFTFEDWQAALAASIHQGKGVHDVNADPAFVSTSDYHLQSTSPAIGAGVDLGFHVDYDKAYIAGVPALGAFEFIS